MIKEAMEFAEKVHRGQFRKNPPDTPFFTHPYAVAKLVWSFRRSHGLHMPFETQTANAEVVALLHDVLEDCPSYSSDDIRRQFGDDVASAVLALTKYENEPYDDAIGRVANQSLVACIVKMCDNIHNISTWPKGDSNKAMQWRLSAMFLRSHMTHHYQQPVCGLWASNTNIHELVARALADDSFGVPINNLLINNKSS